MTQHQFTEVVTDRNYYPLPVENPDLEHEALELAYSCMRAREAGNWKGGALLEAKIGMIAQRAEGTSRDMITGLQHTLIKDMARRLRDSKPQLRAVK